MKYFLPNKLPLNLLHRRFSFVWLICGFVMIGCDTAIKSAHRVGVLIETEIQTKDLKDEVLPIPGPGEGALPPIDIR
jgi:hypothetical protein